MKARKQWVCFKLFPDPKPDDPEHLGKDPYIAGAHRRASDTNPDTWRSFDLAVAWLKAGECDVIGYAFSADDPFTGVDLDKCVDRDTGELTATARAIVDSLDSYTERSPSRRGVHTIVKGRKPEGSRKKLGNYEAYDRARFFTVTGNHVEGTPTTINERQEELDGFCAAYLQPPAKNAKAKASGASAADVPPVSEDDATIIKMAMAAKNGAKFTTLWNGGRMPEHESDSEGDMALARMIAFTCGYPPDENRINGIFKQSARYSVPGRAEKWDKPNGDYPSTGIRTIRTVLDGMGPDDFRKPKQGKRQARTVHIEHETKGDASETDAANEAQGERGNASIDIEIPSGELTVGIVSRLVGDAIAALGERFAVDTGGKLWVYRAGVYTPKGEERVNQLTKALLYGALDLPAKWSPSQAKAVVEYITVDAPELWERPPLDRINVLNGIIEHASTPTRRRLAPHSPDFLSPVQLPITYDPSATCPAVDKFIGEVFPEDTQALPWEILAWLMTPDTRIQKAALFLGEGGCGKSTFLKMAKAFIGQQNTSALPLQKLESDRFAASRLIGKLANVFADLSHQALEGTSVFKSITGGDSIPAEYKFKASFDFTPFSRLLFSANTPPRSPDSTEAFYDRWVVIPFNQRFRGTEQEVSSSEMDAKLADPRELSGVLNKALAVLPQLRKTGRFTESKSTRDALESFRAVTDPFSIWLDVYTVDDLEAVTSAEELRGRYAQYCVNAGHAAPNKTAFGIALKRARPHVETKQRTIGGRLVWCYVGIGPRSPGTGGDDPTSRSSRSSRSSPNINFTRASYTDTDDATADAEPMAQEDINRQNSVNSVNSVKSNGHPGGESEFSGSGGAHDRQSPAGYAQAPMQPGAGSAGDGSGGNGNTPPNDPPRNERNERNHTTERPPENNSPWDVIQQHGSEGSVNGNGHGRVCLICKAPLRRHPEGGYYPCEQCAAQAAKVGAHG